MRHLIYTLLLIVALGARATELTDSADIAYDSANYDRAIELYSQALADEGSSSDLYYNLGNAYYRAGNSAQAILAYERALRLDPANSEAKANLNFVNERIADKQGENGSFLYNTYVSMSALLSSNNWALTAIVLMILTIVGGFVYAMASAVIVRKIGFFGGIVTGLCCLAAIVMSFAARARATDDTYAVITAQSTTLSTAPHTPRNSAEEAMVLHEGTKVRILRSIGLEADSTSLVWHEVQVDNKHRAWINDADIEKIL